MTNKFLQGWAIMASVIGLVLLGVLIGRTTANPSAPISQTGAADSNHPGSGRDETVTVAKPYVVPASFSALPSEWRTESINTKDGFAILFDPERREVIIEKCKHQGYFDDKTRQPVREGQDFCTTLLWGELLSLSETSANTVDRNGRVVDLTLKLSEAEEKQQLDVSFDNYEMALVHGSKNDLFQAIESRPEIIEQKRNMLAFYQASNAQRRNAVQSTASATQNDIPKYVLPERNRELTTEEQSSDR